MSLGDGGRARLRSTPQGRSALPHAPRPDVVRPSDDAGMLIVDRSGRVAPMTPQVRDIWRVPHGGKAMPLNQRFAQMWQLPGRVVDHIVAENRLRQAIERQELDVFFQPQANLTTGRIDGMEALVRWRHPSRGLILPDDFIPLSERTGLIVPLGEWVLRTACAHSAAWLRPGIQPLRLAVNLSARQFEEADLVGMVDAVLSDTQMNPDWLELEITESTTMRDPTKAIKVLHELRDLGLRISMDDFGLGYSSLAHLSDLPFDALKIDRSLISGVTETRSSAAIVTAIVAMAKCLDLDVVAEGVETPGQLAFVKDVGCDRYQGFLLGQPVPANQFSSVLQDRPSERVA